MKLETIRVFAISKLGWIKQQQKKLQTQEREPPREYLDRESHYVWGKRYLLRVVEEEAPPSVEIKHNKLWLRVRPGASVDKRREVLEDWYRGLVKEAAPSIIARWEQRLRVTIDRFYVRRMKTKWGSCTPTARSIRLNTDLAKRPVECLEYIVAHELLHMQTRRHDERFARLMDLHLPGWRLTRQILNATPLAHENWRA
jgi:predicted metal-dependent hydrolase